MDAGGHRGAGRAAYGLVLEGIPAADHLLNPGLRGWPTATIERRQAAVEELEYEQVHPDRARMRLQGGGVAQVDRAAMRTVLTLPKAVRDEEILHPFLATSAAVFSRWLGRDAFHAGALVIDGGAWGVVGDKGAGKSSLMAWAAVNDVAVMTDDLLVVEDQHVLAGPACIDLRPDTAVHLGVGEDLGVVGVRQRMRFVLKTPRPARLPLRGWIYPTWGEANELRPIRPAARIPRLMEHLALRIPPTDPARTLDLAALPAVEFHRPRSWEAMDDAGWRLLAELAQL